MSTEQATPVVVHGWKVYAHPLFLAQLQALTRQVEAHQQKDPTGYTRKNATKRLAAITSSNSHFDFLMGSEAGFRSRNFQTWSYPSQMEPDCLGQTGGGPLC